ncbi:MAG: hypothetical protein IJA75_01830 [Oscillospiraceae bacterium]|nr:hypothetical protein [Oscillospiraceae bacterium]
MTINEAIGRVDALKFNTCPQGEKIRWLSELDGSIKHSIIDRHEGGGGAFAGYDSNTDGNTVLLVPAPFDVVYLRWLEAQIDYHNGEFDRFNAAIILYNTAYEAFANHYKQTHKPVAKGCRFVF